MIGLFLCWSVSFSIISGSDLSLSSPGFIGALIIVYPYNLLHKRFVKIPQERK